MTIAETRLKALARVLYNRACTLKLVPEPHTSWEYLTLKDQDKWCVMAETVHVIFGVSTAPTNAPGKP